MLYVTLFGSTDFRNVKALIDTGADDCLINIEFAEKLGVEFLGKKKIIDVENDIIIDYAAVELLINHFDKRIKTVA